MNHRKKLLLTAAPILFASLGSSRADAQEINAGVVDCEVIGEGTDKYIRLTLEGAHAEEVSVLMMGKGATGYRRLGLVSIDAAVGKTSVVERPLAEFRGEAVASCSASIVSSRATSRPIPDLAPLPDAQVVQRPINAHYAARDKLRHLAGPALGFGLGIGMAFVGGGLGSAFDSAEERNGNGPYVGPGAAIGAYMGFAVGTGLGTAWAWNARETEGATRGALAGGIVGGAPGLGTAFLLPSDTSLLLLLTGLGIGAWIGATVTHKHPSHSNEPGNSLIVRNNEGLSFGMPRLQLTEHAGGKGAALSLLEGHW